jgi:DNA polymerase-4
MSKQEAKKSRILAHLEVHGLAASVEAREHGGSRQPVVLVDEAGQRVVSASPAAQQCGIVPGVSLWEAQRRCPEVVVAEADSAKYAHFWQQILDVCGDYTPEVREVRETAAGTSALQLDLTGTERLFGPAKSIAQEIRNRLRVEVGVAASVGIGPNRMVARLACESARPGEVVEVKPEEVVEFVGRLPVSALPGIDEDWAARLREMGIRHAKDLAALPGEAVRRALGEWGRRVWEIARGGDPEENAETGDAPARYWEKDVFSVQFDLRPPTEERERTRTALRAVTEEVGRRLRQRGQAARQVKLTLVFRDMRKVAARRTLKQPTGSAEVLFQAVGALLDRMKLKGRLVRRVRVTVAHLAVGPNGGQMGLPLLEQEERRERLAEMVDQVKDRFGEASVRRASLHNASPVLVSSPSRRAGNR